MDEFTDAEVDATEKLKIIHVIVGTLHIRIAVSPFIGRDATITVHATDPFRTYLMPTVYDYSEGTENDDNG